MRRSARVNFVSSGVCDSWESLLVQKPSSIRLKTMNKFPHSTSHRGPCLSKTGPTWMPTKKTMKRYKLNIHPICDEL